MGSAFAVATIVAAAVLPLVGPLADRWPARRYLSVVLALVGAALLLLSASASLAAAFAAFLLLRLLCQGAIGVGTLTAVARWFQASRGRALALVGAGYTLGELTMPGAMTALPTALGWRGSLILLGLVYLLVAAPVVLWLLPEPRLSSGTSDTRAPGSHPKVGITLGAAAHSRTFWLLTASMAVTSLVLTGILLHQPAIFRSLGWSADGERAGGYALPLTACAAVAFASAVSVALALPDPVRDRHGIDAEAA